MTTLLSSPARRTALDCAWTLLGEHRAVVHDDVLRVAEAAQLRQLAVALVTALPLTIEAGVDSDWIRTR